MPAAYSPGSVRLLPRDYSPAVYDCTAAYSPGSVRFRDGAATCGPRRSLICIFPPSFTHNPSSRGYVCIHFGNVVVTHASWGMPARNLAALIDVLLACSHSSILQLTSRTSSSQSNACSSRTEADVLWFVICLAKKRKERKMGCGSTFLYLTHSPLSQGFFSTD